MVGKKKESQNPTYFSLYTIPTCPTNTKKLAIFGSTHLPRLTERSDVDEEVEIMVDSGLRHRRIMDHTFPVLVDFDPHFRLGNLLRNEGGDVRLEPSGPDAHDDQADEKDGQGATGVVPEEGRNGGAGQDDMADDGDGERQGDGVEPTEVGIRDVGTEQWGAIDPELVEGADAGGGTLALAERARLAIGEACSGGGAGRKGLLDEIGDCDNPSIQGHGTVTAI
jgi:hypothetical protein